MRAEPAIARAIGRVTRALQIFGIGVIGSSQAASFIPKA
jgi:hypothetical protein